MGTMGEPNLVVGQRYELPIFIGGQICTSNYGKRTYGDGWHDGLDFASTTDPKFALTSRVPSVVVYTGFDTSGFGNTIILRGEDGVYDWYAHLSKIEIKIGQGIPAGKYIGNVGSSGIATGDHLHYAQSTQAPPTSTFINPVPLLLNEKSDMAKLQFINKQYFFDLKTNTDLIVRKDPNTDSEAIKTLPKGAKVRISKFVTGELVNGNATWGWVNQHKGWMSCRYLAVVENTQDNYGEINKLAKKIEKLSS